MSAPDDRKDLVWVIRVGNDVAYAHSHEAAVAAARWMVADRQDTPTGGTNLASERPLITGPWYRGQEP